MHRLTCREHPSGRGLIPVVPDDGFPDPAESGRDEWTILVHGFNNSWKSASRTWDRTLALLNGCGVDLSTVVLFFWPGDYSRWEVLSAMNYSRTVPIATQTAGLLAAYLADAARRRALRLSFVAHSLGSLVVLETINQLRTRGASVAVRDVLLMAAAVPEGYCEPGRNYGDRFSLETRETVLFSLDDGVLKRCFQVGQQLAGSLPDHRKRAVGRTGGPSAGGPTGRWHASRHMDGFGHGDYWRKPEAVTQIAEVVEPRTGVAALRPRECVPPEDRTTLREDSLPTDRIEDAHDLPSFDLLWLGRWRQF